MRWLEAGGYDVAYATDMDLERFPEIATGRRLLLFVGHPEYWSAPARKTLEAAIAAGTNVAFFSANEIYWRVRYEPLPGGQYRTVTCYRKANIDPLADVDPSVATTQWRALPDQHPESLVIGQMYGHIVIAPGNYVCNDANHWIYAGSGMATGDAILNLIGPEYDRVWPALAPPGLEILAVSPVTPNFGHDRGVEDGRCRTDRIRPSTTRPCTRLRRARASFPRERSSGVGRSMAGDRPSMPACGRRWMRAWGGSPPTSWGGSAERTLGQGDEGACPTSARIADPTRPANAAENVAVRCPGSR